MEGNPANYDDYNHTDENIIEEVRPGPVDIFNGRFHILQAVLQDHTYFAPSPELKLPDPQSQQAQSSQMVPTSVQYHPSPLHHLQQQQHDLQQCQSSQTFQQQPHKHQDHTYFTLSPELKLPDPQSPQAPIPAQQAQPSQMAPTSVQYHPSPLHHLQQQQHDLQQSQSSQSFQQQPRKHHSSWSTAVSSTAPSGITSTSISVNSSIQSGFSAPLTQIPLSTQAAFTGSSNSSPVCASKLTRTTPKPVQQQLPQQSIIPGSGLDNTYQRQSIPPPHNDDANSVIITGPRNCNNLDIDWDKDKATTPEGKGENDSVNNGAIPAQYRSLPVPANQEIQGAEENLGLQSPNVAQEETPFTPYDGQRGAESAIVVENYIFHKNRVTESAIYYKCADKSACRARFMTRGQVGSYTFRQHSHPSHALEIAKSRLKKALKEASSRSFESYRIIFDRICNLPEHQIAARHITYRSVNSAMCNARKACYPRTPKSAAEFHQLMMTPKAAGFRTIAGEEFYRGYLNGTLFFVVPDTLSALKEVESTELHVDGTFKTKPSMFGQLLMAYAKINGKVFPLAFMPSECATPTTQQYTQILRKLASLLPQTVEVVSTITDFEKALINACGIVFPQATHQGCLFHYKQAVKRHIVSKCGLQPTSAEYGVYRIALQLPHLPAERIPQGIDFVLQHIRKNTNDDTKATVFEQYLRSQWLRNVPPHVYSVYRVSTTSNNAAESYHAKLLREIGESPSAWVFVEKIIGLAKTISAEISRAQNLPYRREQSARQKFVAQQSQIFDVDGEIEKFLLTLNKKNVDIGCLPLPAIEAVSSLDECVTCAKPATVTLRPCDHMPYCSTCMYAGIAKELCPICGTKWTGILRGVE